MQLKNAQLRDGMPLLNKKDDATGAAIGFCFVNEYFGGNAYIHGIAGGP